jgi:hypothetical protein
MERGVSEGSQPLFQSSPSPASKTIVINYAADWRGGKGVRNK